MTEQQIIENSIGIISNNLKEMNKDLSNTYELRKCTTNIRDELDVINKQINAYEMRIMFN